MKTKSIQTDNNVLIYPYNGEGAPFELEGQKASVSYQFSLKPGVDRIALKGFSAILYRSIFNNGFSISPMWADNLSMAFDIESSTYSQENGIGKIEIIGKRKIETFLDAPCKVSVKNMKLAEALKQLLPKYKKSIVLPGLKNIKVTISPSTTATIRDVIDSLAKQYNFLWCASAWNDSDIFFFELKSGVNTQAMALENVSGSALRYTPIGWFAADQQCFVPPGLKVNIDGQVMVCATTTVKATPGIGLYGTIDFLDVKKVTCFSSEEIKKIKSMDSKMVADLDKPKDPLYVVLATKEKDGLLDGTYVDMKTQFDVVGNDNRGSAVGGIIQSSPWATVDGYGIVFPTNLGTRESIVGAVTDTRSVELGDIPQGVWNKDGTAFHVSMPKGYLLYENVNDLNKVNAALPNSGAWKMKAYGGVTLASSGEEYDEQPTTNVLGSSDQTQPAIRAKKETAIGVFDGQITMRVPKGSGEGSINLVNTGALSTATINTDEVGLGIGASDGVVRKSDLQAALTDIQAKLLAVGVTVTLSTAQASTKVTAK